MFVRFTYKTGAFGRGGVLETSKMKSKSSRPKRDDPTLKVVPKGRPLWTT